MVKKVKRFEVIEKDDSWDTSTRVLKDKKTGVLYIYHTKGAGAGLTVLVDKDGKPLIDEE